MHPAAQEAIRLHRAPATADFKHVLIVTGLKIRPYVTQMLGSA